MKIGLVFTRLFTKYANRTRSISENKLKIVQPLPRIIHFLFRKLTVSL